MSPKMNDRLHIEAMKHLMDGHSMSKNDVSVGMLRDQLNVLRSQRLAGSARTRTIDHRLIVLEPSVSATGAVSNEHSRESKYDINVMSLVVIGVQTIQRQVLSSGYF